MKKPVKQEQSLNNFGEPSYQSPQSAVMGKMGVALPRQEALPMGVWAPFKLKPLPKRSKKR